MGPNGDISQTDLRDRTAGPYTTVTRDGRGVVDVNRLMRSPEVQDALRQLRSRLRQFEQERQQRGSR